jgi:hypothetical protein
VCLSVRPREREAVTGPIRVWHTAMPQPLGVTAGAPDRAPAPRLPAS